MITYKIETDPHNILGRWVIVAMMGSHLSWEVGRYADEGNAHKRLSHIQAVIQAEAMLN